MAAVSIVVVSYLKEGREVNYRSRGATSTLTLEYSGNFAIIKEVVGDVSTITIVPLGFIKQIVTTA